ncbi:MAG: hypothetical protein E4H14_02820 [Candidatus Thorarchaeota archaeon]|nr:MAG: hypothetical protein E4H14_02820 [Candidatus Thorarchaeota archaeon]
MNPFNAAYMYLANLSPNMMLDTEITQILDLQIGFGISLMISCVLLTITLWLFTRSEIGG